jgi:aminomethyltransferase
MTLKRTALYKCHLEAGGKMVDFGGWHLPIQYTGEGMGVIGEHLNCRSAAGLFDVSHMGEVRVKGKNAGTYLDYLLTNQPSLLEVWQAQYSAMCNPQGGIIDDLVVYKLGTEEYLVVVNASNTQKDFNWMLEVSKTFSDLTVENQSAQYSQIAIQGPLAQKILQSLTSLDLASIKTYWCQSGTILDNIPTLFARTGYTGEDGFEIYLPWDSAPQVWNALLKNGAPLGLKPCGLGARDTLRLEMKYALYGQELTETTPVLEAGLGWVVKNTKNYIGKEAVLASRPQKKCIGLEMLEPGIPRSHYAIYDATGTTLIGKVTSGTQSPSLKKAIAIAYVQSGYAKVGTLITVDIRGNKVKASVVKTPFLKKPTH